MMLFSEVIGQEDVKKRLIETVKQNRISHAQLFLGPEGSGKLGLALAYAQYIACKNRGEMDSCGACPSCVKFNKLVHPDLHFIFPVNTTKAVPKNPASSKFLSEWREILLSNPYLNLFQWLEHIGIENKQGIIKAEESSEIMRVLSLKSFESEYKMMIIWMAEKMNASAANKILKILEEPPDKTVFLLVAEDQEQLLPTIISRTQLVKVKPIDFPSLSQALVEQYEISPGDADSFAHLSGGNYLEAVQLMRETEGHQFNQEQFQNWMRLCFSGKVPAAIGWTEEMARIGRERQKHFFSYALHVLRECLMINYGNEDLLHIKGEEKEFSKKFAPYVNHVNINQLIDELNLAHGHIERNANPRILFLDLSFRVMKLLAAGKKEVGKMQ